MGMKIEVLDRSGRPKANVSVKVMYKGGGQDNGYTNGSGIFDTGGSGGRISEIQVSGSTVLTSGGRAAGYNDTVTVEA